MRSSRRAHYYYDAFPLARVETTDTDITGYMGKEGSVDYVV